MREAAFTEFRNQAKRYLDAVERGETVRIYRRGRLVAELVPISTRIPSWKNPRTARCVSRGCPDICDLTLKALERAVGCLERQALRALDALQSGCAHAYRPDLLVSADQRQCDAAREEGLPVEQLGGG